MMRYGSLEISVEDDPPVIYIMPCNPWSRAHIQEAKNLASVIGDGTEHKMLGSTVMVPYTADVDCRLMCLIDLLAGIRCSVPQMVQLQLSLDIEQSRPLRALLQDALQGMADGA